MDYLRDELEKIIPIDNGEWVTIIKKFKMVKKIKMKLFIDQWKYSHNVAI